ncbi:MAG TPA: mechanosensitive ion channel domain-containing protein [Candidatus Acidoferrum sp.]|nr:mechanosensitive ion channel domain-containing protein [Candidatus Acidoferrum sp.]
MSVDFSAAWNTGAKIVNQSIALIPNLILAVAIFIAFLVTGSISSSLVRRFAIRHRKHQGIALLLGRLVNTSVVILGFLVALSVVAPSFQASDLIKILGIGSVAIGFAFQNILQNFLAGILLLLQEPFIIGDFISVNGIEGTVYDVQSRATVITTREGRQVIIPNAIIFTSPVAVEHPAGHVFARSENAAAARSGAWRDLFKQTFRRPSSPDAK